MKPFNLVLKSTLLAAALVGAAHAAPAPTYEMRIMTPGVKPVGTTPPVVVPPEPAPPAGTATGALESLESTVFGSVWVGQAQSRAFRFTNVGNAPATGLYGKVSGSTLTVGASSCGTAASPVSLLAGQSCTFTATYRPTDDSPLNGSVSVEGSYSNAPMSMSVTGSGFMEAQGAFTANTTADFGAVALSGTASRSFTLTNNGNLAATGVAVNFQATLGLAMSANTCGTAGAPGTLAAGASCGVTMTYGGSTPSRLTGAALAVTGSFAVTPAPLTLQGSIGGFNVEAYWSSATGSSIAPDQAFLNFGQKTTGTTTLKDVVIMSTRANGGPAVGFILSGDTAHFRISNVRTHNGASTFSGCPSGSGTIAPNQLSSAVCNGTAYPNIVLSLQYVPSAPGNHQILVTPITNNGTTLPQALTFVGTGQFNPTAVWSSSSSSVLVPSGAAIAYGSKPSGTTTTKIFYLRNTGTNGPLSVGFSLVGDTSHFKLVRLDKVNSAGSTDTCVGGVVAADKLSATPCTADDVTASRSTVKLQLSFTPTSSGSHSISVVPTTNNGTVLPAAMVLTGTSL
jgi:hypothetical protein